MRKQESGSRPDQAPTETRYEKEPEQRQGTMGGQAPLHAPAGVQGTGHGGVLTEKGKIRKEQ